MEKIYTRTKIKIKRKYKIITLIILIVILISVLLNKVIYPIINDKCIYKAKVLATKIYNEETEKIMKNYTYKDLIDIEKDSEGNITFLESNVILINKIKSEILSEIQAEFLNMQNTYIEINLGSFSGTKMFSNIGPKIKMQVIPSGTIYSSLETEFYSVGVNQSMHRIYLDVTCTLNIISPFETISQSISNRILLAESVIVGTTPGTYYKIDGMDPNNQLDITK